MPGQNAEPHTTNIPQTEQPPPEPQPERPFTLLFFSLDLAGSSALKQSLPLGKWMSLICEFYEEAVREQQTLATDDDRQIDLNGSLFPWKYIGDEVICAYRLTEMSFAELKDVLPKLVSKCRVVVEKLDGWVRSKGKDAKALRGVKGTAWLALIDSKYNSIVEIPPRSSRGPANMSGELEDAEPNGSQEAYRNQPIDFLGRHMDEGFRLASCSEPGRLAVSFDLARLLSLGSQQEDKLVMISYQNFKGIWGSRYYPIIWYEENTGSFEGSVEYDGWFSSPLLADYAKRRGQDKIKISDLLKNIQESVQQDPGLNDGLEWPWTD